MITIAVLNQSSSVTDTAARACASALQTQIDRDFSPIWGLPPVRVAFLPASKKPPKDAWWLVILDNSDQAGALGYHDLTRDGLPLGKVFAETAKSFGATWTVSASHELLEMLVDPHINLAATVETEAGGMRLYAYEVCDACEDDRFGYKVGGVLLSDFVTPAWFESFWARKQTLFDFRNRIVEPFQLLVGGYISIYDVPNSQGWVMLTANRGAMLAARAPRGSRRERRRTPRAQWLKSGKAVA